MNFTQPHPRANPLPTALTDLSSAKTDEFGTRALMNVKTLEKKCCPPASRIISCPPPLNQHTLSLLLDFTAVLRL
jgi:hypothetical protein